MSFIIAAGVMLFAATPAPKTDSERNTMAAYTSCLVNTEAYELRALLDRKVVSSSMGGNWGRYATPSCLSNQLSGPGAAKLSFAPILMRGGVFEALYHKDFGGAGASDAFEGLAAVHYPVDLATADPGAASYAMEMHIGDCTVRKAPSLAERLIDTRVGSDDESAAIQALIPTLSVCTDKGQTLKFSKSIIRGMVAEVLYRFMAAQKGLTNAQG